MNIAFSPLPAMRRASAPKFGQDNSPEKTLERLQQVAEDVKSAKITLTKDEYDVDHWADYDDSNGGRMSNNLAHHKYTRSFGVESAALGNYIVNLIEDKDGLRSAEISLPSDTHLRFQNGTFAMRTGSSLGYPGRAYDESQYKIFMPVMQAISDTLHAKTNPVDQQQVNHQRAMAEAQSNFDAHIALSGGVAAAALAAAMKTPFDATAPTFDLSQR